MSPAHIIEHRIYARRYTMDRKCILKQSLDHRPEFVRAEKLGKYKKKLIKINLCYLNI